MQIKLIKERITQPELNQIIDENFGEMVKGVVDLRQKIIALGGELYADAEALLLEQGSHQEDLWGFNVYKDKSKEERIEYSSFINIRPSHGNSSMDIKEDSLKSKVKKIVDDLID